jgi:hypothetical protein
LFGDQFLTRIQQERSSRQDERRAAARAAHQVVFASAYRTYLRNEEARLRENHPILYEAFLKQRDEKRRQMTAGPIVAPASWLAAFDAEDARLEGLAAYFSNHPQYRILGFWEWDRRLNPAGFGARIQGEVHA